MTPTPERYQVSAVPVGGGERTTGYYAHIGWTGRQKHYIIPGYASNFYGIEIDPATIEPVRVKPILVYDDYEKRHRPKCPSCGRYIREETTFCYWPDCGQAVEWQDTP